MASVINKEPLYLFSKEYLPFAVITKPHSQLQWFGTDTAERYKQEPHPSLRPEDIIYSFNSRGYRCSEFSLEEPRKNTIKVVSIGASEVFGLGLPEDQSFPYLFSKLLEKDRGCSVINWNLGLCGASSDYNSRMLVSVLPALKPDIVLLVFPAALRREHLNDVGRLFLYPNSFSPNVIQKIKNTLEYRLFDPENANQNNAYKALSSDYDDQINLFKNYQVCESLCEKYNTMWLFSTFRSAFFCHIEHLLNTDHFVSPGVTDIRDNYLKNKEDPAICWARDMGHPGILPNQETAKLFYERLKALYSTKLNSI